MKIKGVKDLTSWICKRQKGTKKELNAADVGCCLAVLSDLIYESHHFDDCDSWIYKLLLKNGRRRANKRRKENEI